MKCNIRGDKVTVTKSIKDYVNNKLARLDKYFIEDVDVVAKVVIKVKNRDQIIEVTIPTDKFTLRGEEIHSDLYAAIDLVVDKLERQMTKYKNKLQDKNLKKEIKDKRKKNELNLFTDETEEKIVKRKKIEMKPMSEEEAILQIDMLGHDFFIYKDEISGNVCVLYKRKDGNFGVIATS